MARSRCERSRCVRARRARRPISSRRLCTTRQRSEERGMADVQSLSHSGICVHDLKEAEDFYCGVLGAHPHSGVNFITEDTIKGRSVHKSVVLEDYLIALALVGDFMPMPA